MAKLKDYSKISIRDFLNELKAPTATPGGGSAAALVAALSCALLEMVRGINRRRSKLGAGSSEQSSELANIRKRLLSLISEDARAFETLKAELKKKLSPAKRDQVYLCAASAPVEICECCLKITEAIETEKNKTSLWLISDWREAKLLAKSGFDSAWLNVEINLNQIKGRKLAGKNRTYLKQMRRKMDAYGRN